MTVERVLICSASPDRVNHNAVLRGFVANGFAEVLSEKRVLASSFDHAVEAARRFRPDLVLIFGSCMPDACDYAGIKEYCVRSGAALVFWLHDDPYEFDFNYKIYQYADFIFSNDRWAAYHIDHPHVGHLALAADQGAHWREVGSKAIERDLFFCGVGFPNRRQLLKDCAPYLARYKVEVFGADWPQDIAFCRNQRLDNASLPDLHASSLATLNVGRRFNLANSRYMLDATTPGPRTFEAAMSGTVQCVYFESVELFDYYRPGEEVLLFDSPTELVQLIERLREEPGLRDQIARRAQARTLAEHTYAARAHTILNVLKAG